MKNIITTLKFKLRCTFSLSLKKIKIRFFKREYILTRTACLGNDIQSLIFKDDLIKINFQKSRVDHIIQNNEYKTPVSYALKHIKRKDIWSLIFMQSVNFLGFNNKPKYIIIDSYSELTDQRFTTNTTKQSFFANYTDVENQEPRMHSCEGLLNLTYIQKMYDELFTAISETYGYEIPIMFIQFSSHLDPRIKFKKRSSVIFEAINNLEKESKYNLINIHLEDAFITHSDNDKFYYHYSNETYLYFAQQLKSKLNLVNTSILKDIKNG